MISNVLPFIAAGIVMIALAIPLIRRRVRPNPLYGLRVPATFADESVWYEANARSGRDLLLFGVMLLVVPPVLALLPIGEGVFAGICVGLTLGGAILMCAIGWRRANRLLRER